MPAAGCLTYKVLYPVSKATSRWVWTQVQKMQKLDYKSNWRFWYLPSLTRSGQIMCSSFQLRDCCGTPFTNSTFIHKSPFFPSCLKYRTFFFSHSRLSSLVSTTVPSIFPTRTWFTSFQFFIKQQPKLHCISGNCKEMCLWLFFPFLLAGRGKNTKIYTVNISGKKMGFISSAQLKANLN